MTIPVYRSGDVLTFEATPELAGHLTSPEGSAVVGNQIILPRLVGRLSADGAVYSAERGWDGLNWVASTTEAGR